MYNTADSLEDLDIATELNTYNSVAYAHEHHQIWEDEYKDADFVISLLYENDEDINKIKSLLNTCGYTAYLLGEDEELLCKIGF